MTGERLYQIPFQEHRLFYRPRRHLAFLGNERLAAYLARRQSPFHSEHLDPEIEQFLKAVGYDLPGLGCPHATMSADDPRPTIAALLMTNQCNLRCVYCYANAGAETVAAEMPWSTAVAVIEFVADNAAKDGAEPPSLTFHGGGEPTVHWDLLVRCVEFAQAKDPRIRISMSSNGIWTPEQRRFVCENFQDVGLSMDGVPDVQDAQRPRAGGGESFPCVWESVQALDDAGTDYGVRMTVLPESVDRLPDGVRLLCNETSARAIQVEPTFTNRRGHYADIDLAFADRFAERFMEAWRIGREAGRTVYYSGARPWVVAALFCQAPLKAAVATADGRLVSCFEIFSEQSPLAGGFTVGRVFDGRVVYDRGALQAFLDAQQRRRQECEDCFCYWHCCGDCATRRPGPRSSSEGRCRVTQKVTLAMLLAFMEEGGGVWQGLRESTSSSAEEKTGVEAR